MELNEVLEKRRSIRKYLNKEVSNEDIEAIINAAIQAPSWKNSQVARYYVVKSEDMLEKIRLTLPENNYNNCKDAPVLIVTTIVLNRSGYNRDGTPTNDLGNGWGYYDCGMHHMNLCLKATELGLGTLIMGLRDQDKIKELLEIGEEESVVAVISLGYPDIDPIKPKRKSVEDITKFY